MSHPEILKAIGIGMDFANDLNSAIKDCPEAKEVIREFLEFLEAKRVDEIFYIVATAIRCLEVMYK